MSEGEITVGELRRQVLLGSESLYRVCACDGDHVEVEVVRAPGLRPGLRFAFTADAVAAMSLVDDRDAS
ncbi:MAG: hypothetical protein ACLPZR_05400 [Solirubrobacteraceae bacterium]